MKKFHTILVFAQNKRGVLERISMTIRKKMYNLEQITASDTERSDIKRITISFSHQEGEKIPQIISQIEKIVEVIEVKLVHPMETIQREVALIKLKRPENMTNILSLVQIFSGRVAFTTQTYLLIEITGSPSKIGDFIELLRPYEILELGSSGAVAMEK